MSTALPRLDICVCTYRRAHLRTTLSSLTCMTRPEGVCASILVIDNDAHPSAEADVMQLAACTTLPVRYVHCPHSNISIARNGALDHSDADFLAFIDDDEIASENWLRSLWAEMTQSRADVVLGPVNAVYEEAAPRWMQRADIHSTRPVRRHGAIQTGYTCNVLIRRAARAVKGVRFDLRLGQSGGEDTRYFNEIFRRGGRIAYAPEAQVFEDVPPERARFGWLMKRRFRMGQTHARLPGLAPPRQQRRLLTSALAKLIYSTSSALAGAFNPVHRNRAILRAALHAGVVAAVIGLRDLRLYGSAAPGRSARPQQGPASR